MLPERHHDESREQRAQGLPEVSADLKQALREAVPAARRRAGDAGRLRVEDGAANADHRHREQDQQIGIGESQQHQADQREGHAGRQDEIQRPLVQAHPDQRLKERGGELEDEGDEADLEEAQREPLMEDRIERRRERLHHVVEHMRGAERDQDADRRRLGAPDGSRRRPQRMSAQSSRLCPRAARLDWRAGPKNQAAKAALCQVCAILWALRPLIVNSRTGNFPSQTFKKP